MPYITVALEEALNNLIKRRQLFLPNLSYENDTILIFSDYGGEHQNSKFTVLSFLVCSHASLGMFKKAQEQLRREHKLDIPLKEFTFKDIGYGPQDRAFDGYLGNLNNLVCGMLISVVIDRTISLWGSDKSKNQIELVKILADYGMGEWKPHVAEKLVTITHLVSYIIALLAKDGQKVLWQSDDDAIMANVEKMKNTGRLFASVLSNYSKKKLSKLGYGKSWGKDSPLFLDLLSAPDLAAGCIEHYLTKNANSNIHTIKEKADMFLAWYAYQGIMLKKYAFIFNGPQNNVTSGILQIRAKKPPMNTRFLDVPYAPQ